MHREGQITNDRTYVLCRVVSTKPEDDSSVFQLSSQHLFRYASEWDPREPGHTKVGRYCESYREASLTLDYLLAAGRVPAGAAEAAP